jgi:hypothetical protein
MTKALPQKLYGFDVYVTPDTPKMQLSLECPVSPDVRVYINAWMREFFGTTNLIEDGAYIVQEAVRKIWTNPRTYERLKAAAKPVDDRHLTGGVFL